MIYFFYFEYLFDLFLDIVEDFVCKVNFIVNGVCVFCYIIKFVLFVGNDERIVQKLYCIYVFLDLFVFLLLLDFLLYFIMDLVLMQVYQLFLFVFFFVIIEILIYYFFLVDVFYVFLFCYCFIQILVKEFFCYVYMVVCLVCLVDGYLVF